MDRVYLAAGSTDITHAPERPGPVVGQHRGCGEGERGPSRRGTPHSACSSTRSWNHSPRPIRRSAESLSTSAQRARRKGPGPHLKESALRSSACGAKHGQAPCRPLPSRGPPDPVGALPRRAIPEGRPDHASAFSTSSPAKPHPRSRAPAGGATPSVRWEGRILRDPWDCAARTEGSGFHFPQF